MTIHQSHAQIAPEGFPEPLALERIDEQYKGQWVLVQVTACNEYRTPVAGHVIASGTIKQVSKVLSTITPHDQATEFPYYVFAAGALVRSGTDAMRQLIERLPPQGRPGAAGRR